MAYKESQTIRVKPSEQSSVTAAWISFGWGLTSAYDIIKPETPRSPGYHEVELSFERDLSGLSGGQLAALDEKAKSGHEPGLYNIRKERIERYTAELLSNPNSASVYFNRGTVYSNQGESGKALADFEKAAEIEPDNANYKNLVDFEKAKAAEQNQIQMAARRKKGGIIGSVIGGIIGLFNVLFFPMPFFHRIAFVVLGCLTGFITGRKDGFGAGVKTGIFCGTIFYGIVPSIFGAIFFGKNGVGTINGNLLFIHFLGGVGKGAIYGAVTGFICGGILRIPKKKER